MLDYNGLNVLLLCEGLNFVMIIIISMVSIHKVLLHGFQSAKTGCLILGREAANINQYDMSIYFGHR